jgi:hypothetical protein
MEVTMIRVLVLAVSAAFVLAPAVAYAECAAHTAKTAQAASTDLAAKKKAAPATTDAKGDASKTAPAK